MRITKRSFGQCPEDRLDSEAIKALAMGWTWAGHDSFNRPFIQEIREDGTVAYRDPRFLLTGFIPDAPPEVAANFDELQLMAASPENALMLWEMNAQVEATDLAKRVSVPTLVLHCAGDRVAPLEEGRGIARFIADASFIELPGNNHVILAGTPAFDQFFDEVTAFLTKHNR